MVQGFGTLPKTWNGGCHPGAELHRLGPGAQSMALGAPTLSSVVPQGLQHISEPVLGTNPAHGAGAVTGAIGERLPEIDGTCHAQRGISSYLPVLSTSSKMQGL